MPKRNETIQTLDNSPLNAYERAQNLYFQSVGHPTVESKRRFVLNLLLIFALIINGIAWNVMLPLKTIDVRMVRVDSVGRAVVDNGSIVSAKDFKPAANELKYHLGAWAEKLLTIDPKNQNLNYEFVYNRTRGNAQEEFRDFLQRQATYARIKEDPNLIRDADVVNINIKDQVAFIHVDSVERTPSKAKSETTRWIITVHFIIAPPKEEKDVFKNPLGLYVSHFEANKE